MKKHIVLPTDFSDNAWSAAVYALKLYAEVECKFYFLHAWSVTTNTTRTYITANYVDSVKDDAWRQLAELKEMSENADSNANHSFEIILSSDKLQKAIDATVEKYSIDLIVMGTKGASKTKELFFGSNTVNTLKTNLCPILVVPDEFDFIEPKQIAFPTDFNRFYGEELEPIKYLAELYNSKIRIVHITKNSKLTSTQDYNLSMLKVYLENHPHTFHWMPDYAKKHEEINDFIEELDIDILVMINYKHSLIENIMNEPVVHKIGFHPKVPFLVIPSKA
ncbi:universal stress protein [Winogradskyella thalassocola]|uniref:Nucleotide-binding universal stress protein, UspA family n=1 Tax=Winogradskyella thalassocola TaxID=262004 RepID=A0A1G8BHH9_9FLAO|nr:universal stress protein [Winogradskyella thalassocola]SDH32677.1 Nucleotide-binding universal stress protein, UspA family [Winogradskyella thalassocola]